MLNQCLRFVLSDYRRMVLASIGPWRFIGKLPAMAIRVCRAWSARLRGPRAWSPTLFRDDPRRSPLSGNWLFGARADLGRGPLARDRDRVLAQAHRARRGLFHINGREVNVAESPCHGRWDVDPVSGRRWPTRSVFEPLGDPPGDVRFPWELDRLHQLVWFGQAWRFSRDPIWTASATACMDSLLREAPFEHGIHWRDGLQLAVRLYSLIALADLCHDAPDELHGHLNNAVAAHAFALARQLSPHSEITNNHVIGEACGLALAGLYLGQARYVQRGLRRLRLELRRQIYADGVPYEGTVPYIRFDLDFLALLTLAMRGAGAVVPAWLTTGIAAIGEALASMADARGGIPPIGDGDDGRVLRLDDEPYLIVNESLHLAGLVSNTRLAPARTSGTFALWTTGTSTEPLHEDSKTVHLPDSGLVHLQRSALNVWLDCGPTGCGPRGPGGHGHNDTTAIVVHMDGRALLHDPGWFTYHGERPIRDRLRGTGAHNTVRVDGQEQARLGALFEILDDCRPTRVRVRHFSGQVSCVSCGHDGYDRLGKGVVYKRTVILAGDGPWRLRVTDRVRSRAPVKVEAHLGSDLRWSRQGRDWVLDGRHRLSFQTPPDDLRCSAVWCSRTTGVLAEGSALDWLVPESCAERAAGLSYVTRWELAIHPPLTDSARI